MIKPVYLRLALPTPLRRLFDYLPLQDIDPTTLIPGIRIKVPFQSRMMVGILIAVVQESVIPVEKLKTVVEILDKEPLFTAEVYQLCQWAADYYHHALGEVLMSSLPALLRKGKQAEKKAKKTRAETSVAQDTPPVLNTAQAHAVSAICAAKNSFHIFLLDGVTGSGKTEVYLRAITDTLQRDQQVLVLVPEISLTPQTIARFQARFAVPIVALHSNLSEQARLQAWLAARDNEAKIVIGTRSAVFTPFAQLGLIIVDEEHDISFKQQDRFRYHARDLAIMRASMKHIPIVLGSATPSLESYLNVKRKRYDYLSLPMRAGVAQLPDYQLIDLRKTTQEEGLSDVLLQTMHQHLEQQNQVMLFLNRRGFAPVLYCIQCGWMAKCRRCEARMVYHHAPRHLQCHHCDAKTGIPAQCLECKNTTLQPVGLGTQRLEQVLLKHFPTIPIIRVDRDNTRKKGAMQTLFAQIHAEKKAILLGTQMLAKGHHFPNVTLVGVVDADSGLFSVDFRAAEQMGQLLLQVSGRAGRAEKPGTVVIQTHHPEHPLLQTLLQQGYQAFSEKLLTEREQSVLPPFSYCALIKAEAYKEKNASDFLDVIKNMCTEFKEIITFLGPAPALLSKRKGLYCQHLLVKSERRSVLQSVLKTILQEVEKNTASSVKWVLDVDPFEVV